MNILLTTAAAPLVSPFFTGEKRPPLGLGFLAAVLRDAGHQVHFVDNYLQSTGFPGNGYLEENRIDLVGIYANTICYRDVERMLYALQRMRKRGEWRGSIVAGGPHTSVAVDTIPEFVDHIVIGEGEQAILDIVAGSDERVLRPSPIEDLDTLPRPAYDLFAQLPYDWSVDWIPKQPVFTMNTSRGCPFNCTFCSVGSVWGRCYKHFSVERIVDDIRYLMHEYGARGIYFREDNFTASRKRIVSFCERLLRENLHVQWMCETRVDTLDRGILELMQRAGCTGLYLGLESGSQRILDLLKKGITVEQSARVLAWCRELGINTYGSFLVGVPTESEEERQATIDFANRTKPSVAGFNVFVGIPRSPLYDLLIDSNYLFHVDDLGLAYLPWHDELVDRFYGGNPWMKVPTQSTMSRQQLDAALQGFRGRDALVEAQSEMLRALSLDPSLVHDQEFFLDRVGSQAIRRDNRLLRQRVSYHQDIEYIKHVFRNLPPGVPEWPQIQGKARGRMHAELAFHCSEQGDRIATAKHAILAFCYDPSLLKRRSLVLVALESALGRHVTLLLGRAKSWLLAQASQVSHRLASRQDPSRR
jgi:radical SAM superfamily enzyme YgiQ (UPF0313 family)